MIEVERMALELEAAEAELKRLNTDAARPAQPQHKEQSGSTVQDLLVLLDRGNRAHE